MQQHNMVLFPCFIWLKYDMLDVHIEEAIWPEWSGNLHYGEASIF